MNLCPCGARGDPALECKCSPQRLAAFRDKLSRALLDRFDLVVAMPRPRARRARGRAGRALRSRRGIGWPRPGEARRAPRRGRAATSCSRAVERLRSRAAAARGRGAWPRRSPRSRGAAVGAEHVAEALSYRVADRARSAVSELALAAFAAETGSHLVHEPRDGAFRALRTPFDETAYLARLREAGVRWIARSAAVSAAPAGDPRPAGGAVRPRRGRAGGSRAPAVAVVGRALVLSVRRSVARMLGRELAAAGLVVVSGLARGVDGEAHRGALEAGARRSPCSGAASTATIRPRIASSRAGSARPGLIVSEYAPGVEPAPWRFPARNRIIAGLSAATVVVEARERSGALITADLALEEGREVFAVPGEITSRSRRRDERLLKLGATPLTAPRTCWSLRAHRRRRRAGRARLPAEAVLARLRDGPASADELARATGLDAGALASALAELELAGARSREGYVPGELHRHMMAESVLAGRAGNRRAGPATASRRRRRRRRRDRLLVLRSARRGRPARARARGARVAEGASGRNGGFALRGAAPISYRPARERFGREAARLWRLTERALDGMAELAGDAFRRVGSLRLADDEELEALRARVRGPARGRVRGRVARGAPPRLAPLFRGAILHPTDGSLQPARLVRRLARSRRGRAEIVEESRVESLDEIDAEHASSRPTATASGLLGGARRG